MIVIEMNNIRLANKLFVSAIVLFAVTLTSCSSFGSKNSPDVVYSETAVESRSLQVPPDLTDVSNAEQFVLPGTGDSAIGRNTLLPQVDSIRFVREGGQSWLEFQQTPEDLWPQLLAFLRVEKYPINQTVPLSGLIATDWRAADEAGGEGILRGLVGGGDEQSSRVAFRLERAGGGARLFARAQLASTDEVQALTADDLAWPANANDPENTSELLNRFLGYLGVEQQKVRGILGEEQARAVLEDAVVQSNASGNELLVNRGFKSSFERLRMALQALDIAEVSSDLDVGRIEFEESQTPLVMQVAPVHVSAVRVSVTDTEGARLSPEREEQLLVKLADQLDS